MKEEIILNETELSKNFPGQEKEKLTEFLNDNLEDRFKLFEDMYLNDDWLNLKKESFLFKEGAQEVGMKDLFITSNNFYIEVENKNEEDVGKYLKILKEKVKKSQFCLKYDYKIEKFSEIVKLFKKEEFRECSEYIDTIIFDKNYSNAVEKDIYEKIKKELGKLISIIQPIDECYKIKNWPKMKAKAMDLDSFSKRTCLKPIIKSKLFRALLSEEEKKYYFRNARLSN